ncbi:MAG: 30S ribosome-binding factor RbfA [Bacteroidales bacterium]|nr:30S ribosome-binding factor RbfA [Bacteroidales bacterium]MDY2930620.1 30S ribosome-binding factor RbfA [Muribaculaceae bacterium]MDD6132915.1 30S ribosome-binding factor RbfA [Bacteroidales bacterium]MDD6851567.1 30S ribosome-binding factor RbfA [Bacteroidales bacterium]MDD7405510.1 30S ribosome-binding factor RbfA [Bacteroidales bacterium]
METTRQQKIARLIQKELSEIFRLETAKIGNVIVSVSTVRVSPDLSIAKAYLSVFPSNKGEEIVANINKNSKSIRYDLAQKVRFQLRKTPELAFYLDDSLDYIEHIDNLLKSDPTYHPGSETPDAE